MAGNKEEQGESPGAGAWLPGPRGAPADLGGGGEAREEPKLPLADQPQSKVDKAAEDKEEKDEVMVGSEESFPASDPPSYQPVRTGRP